MVKLADETHGKKVAGEIPRCSTAVQQRYGAIDHIQLHVVWRVAVTMLSGGNFAEQIRWGHDVPRHE